MNARFFIIFLCLISTALLQAETITTHKVIGHQDQAETVTLGNIEYELNDISNDIGIPAGDLQTLARDYFGLAFPRLKLTLEGGGDSEQRYFKEAPNAKVEVTFGDLNLDKEGVKTAVSSQINNLSLGSVSACDLVQHGNPIHIGTGNKFQKEPQFSYISPGKAFSFELLYNSQREDIRTLGRGWSHSFDISGTFNFGAGWAGIRRADGKLIEFIPDDAGIWQSLDGSNNRLEWTNKNVTWVSGNIRYRFDHVGHLLRVEDFRGQGQTLSYRTTSASNVELVNVKDDFGGKILFGYDSKGRLNTVTDMAGSVYRYHYDKKNNLIRSDRPDNSSRQYRYEDKRHPHHLTGIIDGEGRRYASFAYDEKGRGIVSYHGINNEITDKTTIAYISADKRRVNGHEYTVGFKNYKWVVTHVKMEADSGKTAACGITQRTFFPDGKLSTTTDENGSVTHYTGYDRWGRARSVTRNPGTAWQRYTHTTYHPVFDKPSRIVRSAPNGELTTDFRYDSRGNLLQRNENGLGADKRPVRREYRYDYDKLGRLIMINGSREDVQDITRIAYYPNTAQYGHNRGRLRSRTGPDGLATTMRGYNAFGNPVRVQSPDKTYLNITYDTRNRLVETRLEAGTLTPRKTLYHFDKVGLTTGVTSPDGRQYRLEYNSAHKTIRSTDHRGTIHTYHYDERGNTVNETVTDKNGNLLDRTLTTYDRRDLPLETTDALGNTTRYTYDPGQRLTAVTNALDHVTRMVYNPEGQVISITAPLDQLTRFDYDNADNLKRVTDPVGIPTQYLFDDLGRSQQEQSHDRGQLDYVHNSADQVTRQTDAEDRQAHYTYDEAGRITRINFSEHDNITLNYDESGRITKIEEPWGNLSTDYTAYGDTKSITQAFKSGHEYTQQYHYDSAGRVTRHTLPSGKSIHYNYKNGDLTSIYVDTQAILIDIKIHGTGRLQSATYGNGLLYNTDFDAAGRITGQQRGANRINYAYDKIGNITQQAKTAYQYDALNRLTAANDPTLEPLQYRYDANGNRQSLTTGNTEQRYLYQAGTNRLIAIGDEIIRYDNSGRRIEDARRLYTYNARGRLEHITHKSSNTKTRYQYRLDGLRVRKQTGNKTTHFIYDTQQRLIAEANASGKITREYIWHGLMPVAVFDKTSLYFIHTDHLGTPRLATDTNQQTAWQWQSTPFGVGKTEEKGLTLNLRFPGQYYDYESGLHYNWNRYYDPRIGRYITSDPIGLKSSTNIYVYVNSNPVVLYDTTGLLTEVFVWKKNSSNSKDVGHTAIRLNGFVFGFYPVDTNNDGSFSLDELLSSKGELHVDSLADFNIAYKDDIVDAFELNTTKEQEKSLFDRLEEIYDNPDNYSLSGSHCTTVAIKALDAAGIINIPEILLLPNSPNELREHLSARLTIERLLNFNSRTILGQRTIVVGR